MNPLRALSGRMYSRDMNKVSSAPRLSAPAVRKVLANIGDRTVVTKRAGLLAVYVGYGNPQLRQRAWDALTAAGYRPEEIDGNCESVFAVEAA